MAQAEARKAEAQTPPPGSKQNQPLKRDGSRNRRVKVHRTDLNKEAPITVFVNDIKNKREFYPGQEVTLTEELIDSLKMARFETTLDIPPDSGVYEAANPRMEAQRLNPGFQVRENFVDGTLQLIKSEPKYVVDYLD